MCLPADCQKRLEEVFTELALVDTRSIRALRENDVSRLLAFEAQAQVLRAEMYLLKEKLESRSWQ